jgi:hypothetical protein
MGRRKKNRRKSHVFYRFRLADHTNHSGVNNHTARLSQFGILDVIRNYQPKARKDYPYTCQLPPENEWGERQFTVIFMAHNPERLQKLYNQTTTATTTIV